MKILLINKYHYLRGGAERAYFDTAGILEKAGHEVAFFSMKHPQNRSTPWAQYFVDQVEYEDNRDSFLHKVKVAVKMVWNSDAQRKLEQLIQDFRPDVAHLHNAYHQLSPSILWTLKKYGVPAVMTLHDYKLVSPNYSLFVRGKIWEGSKPDRYWRCVADRCVKDSYAKSLVCTVEAYLHRWLRSYEKVDAFIAPSRFLIEKFKEFGFKKEIEHVPQPLVPFPKLESAAAPAADAPFVFLGRLSSEKGIDTALEAVRKYTGLSPLWIIGTGPEETRLKEMARDLGDRVKFFGYQSGEDLKTALKQSKALILPSVWYENMPYVMLEALGAGKPVIASRLGGIAERITDGMNGYLFEPGDASDLASAMTRLGGSDWSVLSQNALESVADLDPERYLSTLERSYTSLIQANKKSA